MRWFGYADQEGVLRVATWNLKQAVAPKVSRETLWEWARDRIAADVVVMTEAAVPKSGMPDGWTAVWREGGLGTRMRWGTDIAGRGVELVEVPEITVSGSVTSLYGTWPGSVVVTDVLRDGERWATVVGLYAVSRGIDDAKIKHGGETLTAAVHELDPLFADTRSERLIVAGDFNVHPHWKELRCLRDRGLVDLVEYTRDERPALEGCISCRSGGECGHLWTHKNGNSPNATRQQIDFIFASKALARELAVVYGGSQSFPDAWEVSDHAPVVGDFK